MNDRPAEPTRAPVRVYIRAGGPDVAARHPITRQAAAAGDYAKQAGLHVVAVHAEGGSDGTAETPARD